MRDVASDGGKDPHPSLGPLYPLQTSASGRVRLRQGTAVGPSVRGPSERGPSDSGPSASVCGASNRRIRPNAAEQTQKTAARSARAGRGGDRPEMSLQARGLMGSQYTAYTHRLITIRGEARAGRCGEILRYTNRWSVEPRGHYVITFTVRPRDILAVGCMAKIGDILNATIGGRQVLTSVFGLTKP